MLTYKIIVNRDRKNSLLLRLTNNRRTSTIALGVRATPLQLRNALSSRPTQSNLKLSKFLSGVLEGMEYVKAQLKVEARTDEDVKVIREMALETALGRIEAKPRKKERYGEFVEWFMRKADTHLGKLATTRQHYLHTLSKLRAFEPEIDKLGFADITVGWLDRFDRFLSQTSSLNTRSHHLRAIRAVFKYAIRNDLDIRNPFDRMSIRTEKTRKRAVSAERVRHLATMEVRPHEEVYRDMFMLSFMLIGINAVDLYRVKRLSPDGRLEYRRAKTHKLYSVKVEPEAAEIINRYRGKSALLMLADRWMSHNSFAAGCNTALRSIGAPRSAPKRPRIDAGDFPGLTWYVARHSWATIAAEIDIPDAVIGQALGHSSANPVTEIYIDRNQKKVDDANRKVLDYVLYGKDYRLR